MKNKKSKTIVIVLIILGIILITSGTTLAYLNSKEDTKKTNNDQTNIKENPINIENKDVEEKIETNEIVEEVKKETETKEKIEEKQITESKKEEKEENNQAKSIKENSNNKTINSNTTTTNKNNTSTNSTTSNSKTNVAPAPSLNYTPTVNVNQVVSDQEIIPDKYNTGASGNLKKYTIGDSLQGLDVRSSGNKDKTIATINFNKAANQKSYYLIENVDFTNYDVTQFITGTVPNKVKIKFKNCKFKYVSVTLDLNDNISLELENCTLQTFNGSNTTLNKCKFGQGTYDSINPFKNVTVKNSYISDIAAYDISGERHYDGVQITGTNSDPNFLVKNIHFYNTRFETPYVREIRNGILSKSSVNAPIMLQMKFNDGTDISFENIYANGGGYTIYAVASKDNKYTNVVFKNVKIGYGHVYHELYPVDEKLKSETKFINFGHYDSLYVSSVWKDNNGIHVITTNDTLVERKLTCETDNNKYTFTIQAHPKLTKDNSVNYQFSDMPYDIDKVVNDPLAKFIRCYDTTSTIQLSNNNLIRTQKF